MDKEGRREIKWQNSRGRKKWSWKEQKYRVYGAQKEQPGLLTKVTLRLACLETCLNIDTGQPYEEEGAVKGKVGWSKRRKERQWPCLPFSLGTIEQQEEQNKRQRQEPLLFLLGYV